jgi:hypothetical protein
MVAVRPAGGAEVMPLAGQHECHDDRHQQAAVSDHGDHYPTHGIATDRWDCAISSHVVGP